MEPMRANRPRAGHAALAGAGVVAAIALAACGSDDVTVDAGSPAKRPSEAALKDLPPALAQNVRDADTFIGEGSDVFQERLAELRGYPVVVNQWASWCEPCRFELPFFESMTAKYREQVGFIGIDMQDDRGSAEEFMAELPSGLPSVFDPDASLTTSLGGGRASPTTFFFDKSGRQVNTKIGAYASPEDLEADIRRFALAKAG
jgi:cytochrome c biogenesis protein CcmG, thiol:disulfide interchange protein DsbE